MSRQSTHVLTAQVRGELERAAGALNRGDLAAARSVCEQLLRDGAGGADAFSLLALVRKREGDAPAAEALMKRALELDGRRADIRGNLANLYRSLRRHDEAIAEYRRALDSVPSFRPARLGLAQLLLDTQRAGEALAEAQKLSAANAADAEALNVVGSACRQLGRPEDAEQAFRQALAIAPGYATARHNLGALLASLSRSEEALGELDRAAAAGVAGIEICHNRAAALMALGRFDEAESLLQETLAATPDAVTLQMLLASLRYMRGDEAFASVARVAVDADPGNAPLRIAYARILSGAEQLDAAIASVAEGLAADARNPALLAEMSSMRHRRGDYREALEAARQAIAIAPGEARLNDLAIQALLSLGDSAAAMPLIEAARRREPRNQYYIALEATAARLLDDPRYAWLCDFERLVQRFEIPAPPGWSTIEDFHRDLVPVLNDRHRFVAPPLDQSLRGGTQTPRGLLGDPDPAIRALLAAVHAPITSYRERIGDDPAHPLSARNRGPTRLSGCWSVRLQRSGFHVNHVHSEGWISSAYYVEVPDEVADPETRSGWLKLGEPGFFVPGAGPEVFVRPEPGVLVLFPSYLWHGTTPIRGDEPRLTIAFDAVPAL